MKIHQIKFLVPGICWGILIAWLSLDNLPKTDLEFNFSDKIGHFICYALFVLLLLWGFYKSSNNAKKQNYIWIGVGCTLFGVLMEVLQKVLTTDRMFEYNDMLANAFGVLVGTLFFLFLNNTEHG